jgi:hypothetical protein
MFSAKKTEPPERICQSGGSVIWVFRISTPINFFGPMPTGDKLTVTRHHRIDIHKLRKAADDGITGFVLQRLPAALAKKD